MVIVVSALSLAAITTLTPFPFPALVPLTLTVLSVLSGKSVVKTS
jgi:hypothetical protein